MAVETGKNGSQGRDNELGSVLFKVDPWDGRMERVSNDRQPVRLRPKVAMRLWACLSAANA